MQSNSSAAFEMQNDIAGNSHRIKKSSSKRKTSTTSIKSKNQKKRMMNISHDSYTSDVKLKAVSKLSRSKTGKNKKKNKPHSKTNRKNALNGDSEDKLKVSVAKDFPLNSKSNYSSALDLSPQSGSIEEGEKLFGILIKPIPVQKFMTEYWEQKPIRLQRRVASFYKDLISTEVIDKMLRENHVEFTKNIDITQYKDGVRETLNPAGRAMPPCNFKFFLFQIFIPVSNFRF